MAARPAGGLRGASATPCLVDGPGAAARLRLVAAGSDDSLGQTRSSAGATDRAAPGLHYPVCLTGASAGEDAVLTPFAVYVQLAARVPVTPRPLGQGNKRVRSDESREARRVKHAAYMRRRRASKAPVVVD